MRDITRRRVIKVAGSGFGLGIGTKIFARNGKATASLTICRKKGDATLIAEHCRVSEDLLKEQEIGINEQIRVGSDDFRTTYESGLYTIAGTTSSAGTIEMGKEGLDRLGLKNNSSGFVQTNGPHPEYGTREKADKHDEYVEILVDDGSDYSSDCGISVSMTDAFCSTEWPIST